MRALAVSCILLVGVSACRRVSTATQGAPREVSGAGSSERRSTSVPSGPAEPLVQSESEALAKIRTLPEVSSLLGRKVKLYGFEQPYLRVVSTPNLVSSSATGARVWEIMVADRAHLDPSSALTEGYEPALTFKLDADTQALSIRDRGQTSFRDYTAWTELQRAREIASASILSIPEWNARAAISKRQEAGSALGLACDDELSPKDCSPAAGSCRLACDAIRVCDAGCAGGRWTRFEVDLSQRTLYVQDDDTSVMIPYGQWRNRFRAEAAKSGDPAYRTITAIQQAFPDYQPGNGELGYGTPSETSERAPDGLRQLFERAGYHLLRSESYGRTGFKVFVVEPLKASRTEQDGDELQAFAAELVRANGQRACELVVNGSAERFQFDRFTLGPGPGGVYTFVNGAFHPHVGR